MTTTNFSKLLITMGPAIEKETLLAKIANQVVWFRINLSHMTEELLTKYIGYIQKLDASKAILLDTRGPEVRTKNEEIFELKKWEIYSFWIEDCDINIDYDPKNLEIWEKIYFDNHSISAKLIEENKIQILQEWNLWINKNVSFENHTSEKEILSFKDKKLLAVGLRAWANIVSASGVKSVQDLEQIHEYLKTFGDDIKVLAKIQHVKALENIDSLADSNLYDWIIIDSNSLSHIVKNFDEIFQQLVNTANKKWKIVIVSDNLDHYSQWEDNLSKSIQKNIDLWIDGFLLTHQTSNSQNPVEQVHIFHSQLEKATAPNINWNMKDLESINPISDYISYSLFESIKLLKPKIIICPTEKWNMAARIASLKPSIFVLWITKSQWVLKFLNLLWGTKGFKISSSQEFDLENIRRISKEVIRNIFKWDINLDDNIILVHSNLSTSWSANWFSIYKFKDL